VNDVQSRSPVGSLGTLFYILLAVGGLVVCIAVLGCIAWYLSRDDPYDNREPSYDPNYHVPYDNAARAGQDGYDVVPDDLGRGFDADAPSGDIAVQELAPEHMDIQWLADDESV
jgi:hypothetical protein